MRLLNTSTLLLHEFFGDKIPKYAILSHRWEDKEVTFQDLNDGNVQGMSGWAKIVGCCGQAVLDGLEYVWIDSCCIDKSSSAELSEAINSMFSWYERSEVCYAYLSDVTSTSHTPSKFEGEFRNSKWFTRGWTLQELLAPYYVDFYSKDWTWIGSKSNLDDLVRDVTRIRDLWNYKDASVAQKMSWASKRETTRIEDQAYSLLGLFGVHMPPLYGEGQNAFIRLQLEILSRLDDDSIFAWKGPIPWGYSGLLAPSPNNFFSSSIITKEIVDPNQPPHSMTSKGLAVQFTAMNSDGLSFLALLNCAWDLGQAVDAPVVVSLPLYHSDGLWRRGPNFLPFQMDAETRLQLKSITDERQVIYVPQVSALADSAFDSIEFVFRGIQFRAGDLWLKDPNNVASWVDKGRFGDIPRLSEFTEINSLASITFWHDEIQKFVLVLGISEGRLWIDLTTQLDKLLLDPDILSEMASPGRDRVSERLSAGSISAKICGSTSSERIVEISYDPGGKLRWPRNSAIYSDQLRNPYGALYSPRVPGKIDSWPKRPSALDLHSNLPPPKKTFHRPKREGFPTVLVHPTPTTLGWRTEIEHLQLYIFKVQKGIEPYFELKDHWAPTNQTPSKVYLDGHEDDKLKNRRVFPCRYPGGCPHSAFKRPADLERHYQNVHTHESRVRYQCDHAQCPRYSEPFGRKYHLRCHLRDFHKEDIGQQSGAKMKSSGSNEINLDMRQIEEKWLAERKIETQWWRCGKCLIRCNVAMNGWVCPSCKTRCEESRIRARGISPKFEVLPDETFTFGTTYYFCSTCVGNALVEDQKGAWVLCSHCHGDVYLTKPGYFQP